MAIASKVPPNCAATWKASGSLAGGGVGEGVAGLAVVEGSWVAGLGDGSIVSVVFDAGAGEGAGFGAHPAMVTESRKAKTKAERSLFTRTPAFTLPTGKDIGGRDLIRNSGDRIILVGCDSCSHFT
jgi:hypothetical protein